MDGIAIFFMLLSMLLLWGGFIYCVTYALKAEKNRKR